MFSANLVLDLVAGDFWVALYPFSVTYTNSRLLKTPITTNCESGLFSNGTIGPVFMNLLSSSSFTARSKSTLEYGPSAQYFIPSAAMDGPTYPLLSALVPRSLGEIGNNIRKDLLREI